MTNTERLIADIDAAKKFGAAEYSFMVGSCTGNGPAVVNALRRRGYNVEKARAASTYTIRLN